MSRNLLNTKEGVKASHFLISPKVITLLLLPEYKTKTKNNQELIKQKELLCFVAK